MPKGMHYIIDSLRTAFALGRRRRSRFIDAKMQKDDLITGVVT